MSKLLPLFSFYLVFTLWFVETAKSAIRKVNFLSLSLSPTLSHSLSLPSTIMRCSLLTEIRSCNCISKPDFNNNHYYCCCGLIGTREKTRNKRKWIEQVCWRREHIYKIRVLVLQVEVSVCNSQVWLLGRSRYWSYVPPRGQVWHHSIFSWSMCWAVAQTHQTAPKIPRVSSAFF